MKLHKHIYVVTVNKKMIPAKGDPTILFTNAEIYSRKKAIYRAKEVGKKATVHELVKQHVVVLMKSPLVEEIKNEWKRIYPKEA